MMRVITLCVLALALVTACANVDRPLRDLRAAGDGPDEFAVIPQRPLAIPATATLPTPTPGGSNLADTNPNADAIAALGGRASAQRFGGIPSSDAALVAQTGRYGVDPAIRAELAARDEAFRNRRSSANFFNPLGRDKYFPAYARHALDARSELARLRELGIAVPTGVMPQPVVRPQRTTTAQTGPEPVDDQPGLLQRILRPGTERQNCVFTTEGPGNELRRVCTPVEEDQ